MIKDTVQGLFREVFEDDTLVIHEFMNADTIEAWDSLSHILLISKIQKTFNIRFSIQEIMRLKNVGDIIALIHTKI